MTSMKGLMIFAALLMGGTSLAMAQNGLPTGGEPPVAGGAGGNPAVPGPGYYLAAPGYVAPGYVGAEEPSAAPGYVTTRHHRSI
jgi:hypothetical protein